MRLSGWQRIGIVASIAWIVGAAGYEHFYNGAAVQAFAISQPCFDAALQGGGKGLAAVMACTQKEDELRRLLWDEEIYNVAMLSLLPVPFAWLAAYAVFRIGRWITSGFHQNSN